MVQLFVKEIELHSKDYLRELEIREQILRKPLQLVLSEEELANDKLFTHLGIYEENQLVGCCIYTEIEDKTAQIKQVCVLPEMTHQGVGRKLMIEAEKRIKDEGYKQIILHARENAWNFYKHLGYEIEGEVFTEVGIQHKKMIKVL